MKMCIIPNSLIIDQNESINKEDSLINFVETMDNDMNAYFKSIPENQVKDELFTMIIKEFPEFISKAHEKFIIDWMINTLKSDFEEINQLTNSEIYDIAEEGYDIYCQGYGLTEYESIQAAYEKWYETHKFDIDLE